MRAELGEKSSLHPVSPAHRQAEQGGKAAGLELKEGRGDRR